MNIDSIVEMLSQFSTGNPAYDVGVIILAIIGFAYAMVQ